MIKNKFVQLVQDSKDTISSDFFNNLTPIRPVRSFLIIWMCFELLISENYNGKSKTIRDKIDHFLMNTPGNIISAFDRKVIASGEVNVLVNHGPFSDNRPNVKSKTVYFASLDITMDEIVNIAWTVRGNLIHGVDDPDKQIDVYTALSKILYSWLKQI